VDNLQTTILSAGVSGVISYFLGRRAFRYETRYSKLHELKAEAIVGLYARVSRVEGAFLHLRQKLLPAGTEEQVGVELLARAKRAADESDELIRWFDEKRVLLPPILCDRLTRYLDGTRKAWINLQLADRFRTPGAPDSLIAEAAKMSGQADDFVFKQAPNLRKEIEIHVLSELRESMSVSGALLSLWARLKVFLPLKHTN